MIQLKIDERELVAQLITARAARTGEDLTRTAETVVREGVMNWLLALHRQYMSGEISQGHMAELLGISRLDLVHLLERLDLPVTNL